MWVKVVYSSEFGLSSVDMELDKLVDFINKYKKLKLVSVSELKKTSSTCITEEMIVE
jgi:hypothetical protein